MIVLLLVSIIEGAAVVEVVIFSCVSLTSTGLSVGNFSYSGLSDDNIIVVNVTDGWVVATEAGTLVRSRNYQRI